MMARKDGGPAFPIWQEGMYLGDRAGPGMTLRDYFAAQAMSGCLASFGIDDTPAALGVAEIAYDMADAMLEVRKSTPAKPEASR